MLPHLDSLPVPTPPNHLVSLLSDTRSFVFVDKQTLSEGAHHLIAESFRLRLPIPTKIGPFGPTSPRRRILGRQDMLFTRSNSCRLASLEEHDTADCQQH